MPKKTEDKALVKQGMGFELTDKPNINNLDDRDYEGYSEPEYESFTYVGIRQEALVDGSEVIAPAGGFQVRDDANPNAPDLPELNVIVLFDRQYAKTRWSDGKPVCKSLDGTKGINPETREECGSCAVCEWNPRCSSFDKSIPSNDHCKASPLFVVWAPQLNGLCVLTLKPSALSPISAFYKRLRIAGADAGLSQGRRLPAYRVVTRVTTKFVERESYKYYVPVFDIAGFVPEKEVTDLKRLREEVMDSFEGRKEAFEDYDMKTAKDAADLEDAEVSGGDDLPF